MIVLKETKEWKKLSLTATVQFFITRNFGFYFIRIITQLADGGFNGRKIRFLRIVNHCNRCLFFIKRNHLDAFVLQQFLFQKPAATFTGLAMVARNARFNDGFLYGFLLCESVRSQKEQTDCNNIF